MTNPSWNEFEWDDENKKNGNVQHLQDHGIEPSEAEGCFFHEFLFGRDERRFDDVYVMDGKTNRGRKLRLIFQDKGNGRVRIITGWDLSPKKKKR
jgi:uncharacterized DUF497 family protein